MKTKILVSVPNETSIQPGTLQLYSERISNKCNPVCNRVGHGIQPSVRTFCVLASTPVHQINFSSQWSLTNVTIIEL